MTTTQRVWISEHAHQRLRDELVELQSLHRDGGVDAADPNLVVIQQARRSRIQQIHDLLVNAVVGEDPPNDGVAEPGMVLTVRYDDTGDTETFLLGVRGSEHGELEIYSVESPLGTALLGARTGQQRSYLTPGGATVAITLLEALPYGVHRRAGAVA
ncbi:GreA/GreB family elongation factor [Mycolicibacterium mengxianglii]|uniref:GreA/GreB family elongation factor n=1 Tax=Mycolicibacterium mengxianglii TaxID=2736649 RepID=UPI0018EF2AC6|nr:GreA/GreB family elongation factor [Mycolicibacterium mengxianglii]